MKIQVTSTVRTRALINQLNSLECDQHNLAATITRVNVQVAKLREAGLFNETLILGPIVLRRDWGLEGPSDSGELVQAAMCSHRGLVAVFWDTEDLAEAESCDPPMTDVDAQDRARPLGDCQPVIQWLVAKEADKLLDRLVRCARIDV